MVLLLSRLDQGSRLVPFWGYWRFSLLISPRMWRRCISGTPCYIFSMWQFIMLWFWIKIVLHSLWMIRTGISITLWKPYNDTETNICNTNSRYWQNQSSASFSGACLKHLMARSFLWPMCLMCCEKKHILSPLTEWSHLAQFMYIMGCIWRGIEVNFSLSKYDINCKD